MFSPLEQFDVIPLVFLNLGKYDISLFNIFIPLILIIKVIKILENYYFNYKLIPTNIQYILENLIEFIINIIKSQIGKEGFLFLPFIFTKFIFVILANLLI